MTHKYFVMEPDLQGTIDLTIVKWVFPKYNEYWVAINMTLF